MCEQCTSERDDAYTGDTIAEKRRKAVTSIVDRHPELGISPDEITLRIVPRHKARSVRVNLLSDHPTYEIHVPEELSVVAKNGPPIWGIALAATVESDRSYAEVCDILNCNPVISFDALYIADTPSVQADKLDESHSVYRWDSELTNDLNSTNE